MREEGEAKGEERMKGGHNNFKEGHVKSGRKKYIAKQIFLCVTITARQP